MSSKNVIPFRKSKGDAATALQKIIDSGDLKKFVIVYLGEDGNATFENCNCGQKDLAWASIIIGKHSVEAHSAVEVT